MSSEKSFVLVTQRVELDESIQECRDCIDQNWISFLKICSIVPIILPNDRFIADSYISTLKIRGILLTGGNTLSEYGGKAPERDDLELYLIDKAKENKIPILGVCRGMQILLHSYGVKLVPVNNHVKTKHLIELNSIKRTVNSYHVFGAMDSGPEFNVLARSDDGVIEAIEHKKERMAGIMWHPERENPFDNNDIKFFKDFYNEK